MMKRQAWEEKSATIKAAFDKLKAEHPERLQRRIDLSYCCQTFGWEPIPKSIERLAGLGYRYIELPGQYGGPDIGPHVHLTEILRALDKYNMACSGVCTLSMEGFGLNDKNYFHRQMAVDYIRGVVRFARDAGGSYCLLTPAPCPLPPIDGGDWVRAASTLHDVADIFTECGVKGALEPVQPGQCAIVNNLTEARRFLKDVDHPGFCHIYGDTDHILHTEDHVGMAILDNADLLLNLHLRDTNQGLPIGHGMLDVDTVIRALYLIGFNTPGHFACAEPATKGRIFIEVDEETKRMRARDTIETFREREEAVLHG